MKLYRCEQPRSLDCPRDASPRIRSDCKICFTVSGSFYDWQKGWTTSCSLHQSSYLSLCVWCQEWVPQFKMPIIYNIIKKFPRIWLKVSIGYSSFGNDDMDTLTQVKAPSSKEEAMCEHDPKMLPSSLKQSSVKNKQTKKKIEATVLWSDGSKSEILFGRPD